MSSRVAFSFYEASLQAQSKAPDIQFLSFHVSTEELLASFNTQDEAPDDPSIQDCRCVPLDFLKTPFWFRQVFSRSPLRVSTKPTQMFVVCPFSFLQLPVRIPPTSLQALSRKEFDDNWEEFSSASVVVHWTSSTGYLVRIFFKHTCLHLILHFASQGSVQELPIRNQDSPYQGFW
jgi:hypothetical protein